MSNTIQIKRSVSNVSPAGALGTTLLSKGELAWVDLDANSASAGTLYIGDADTGAVKTIGGDKDGTWGKDFRTNTALLGATTFAGGPGSAKYLVDPAWAPGSATAFPATRLELATLAYVDAQVSSGALMASLGDALQTAPLVNGQMMIWDATATSNNGGTGAWQNKDLQGDCTIDAGGNTVVTSVQANSIALGVDTTGQYASSISGTAGEIDVNTPNADDDTAYVVSLAEHVTIRGNLTVQGTTTEVQSTVVTVEDPIFTVGEASADSLDRGISFKYTQGSDGTNPGTQSKGFFGYDRSVDAFSAYINSNLSTGSDDVFNGTLADAVFSVIDGTTINASVELTAPLATVTSVVATNLTGTLQTPSQTNITELGTITVGTWNATEIAQDKGGTGRTAFTANNDLLIGSATGAMTSLQMGSGDQYLHVNNAGTALEYTSVMDGGTF
tara:strand:+ start:785 stop:2116 length:1332 start_codon:yes stop_codon:yes gene_type:complete